MKEIIRFIRLDVHKDFISVSVADESRGEVESRGEIANTSSAVKKLAEKLSLDGHNLCFVYEAGCFGFVLYRQLTQLGGCQFTSSDYQKLLKQHGLVSSIVLLATVVNNAACEGFFGMLKRERIHHRRYRTRNEAKADVFDYLERFHNPRMRRRLASHDTRFTSLLNRP